MLNGTETIHNIANQDCDIRFSLFFPLATKQNSKKAFANAYPTNTTNPYPKL